MGLHLWSESFGYGSHVINFHWVRLPALRNFGHVAQLVEHLFCTQDVAGSIPVMTSIFIMKEENKQEDPIVEAIIEHDNALESLKRSVKEKLENMPIIPHTEGASE